MDILLAWLGKADTISAAADDPTDVGPVLNAANGHGYAAIHLLSNYERSESSRYGRWLKKKVSATVEVHPVVLTTPTNFSEIYQAASHLVSEVLADYESPELTFHLSPGTPAMAAIWIFLAKSRFPAKLIESSREHGVRAVNIPFELAAEFSPLPDRQADAKLTRLAQGMPPEAPQFAAIVHSCDAMKRTVAMAHRLSVRDVPVLIEGESGTGKELFARAIHRASPRNASPFVAVNCGAIPTELVDSELFGHEKGAFTGATQSRIGYFESAHSGTLFLDEIGELPLDSQVRLLRVLQESELRRVGGTETRRINVRIIAATNRKLTTLVHRGQFREDLFHRLAVGIISLPPLRERTGDISLLIDALLGEINTQASTQPGYVEKSLDVAAKNLLLRHSWPGNVRELHNTLTRACIVWSNGTRVTKDDVAESLAATELRAPSDLLNRSLAEPISLPDIMGEVAQHYLQRATAETGGNKTEAARLLGLGSYQTLGNWMKKYDVYDK